MVEIVVEKAIEITLTIEKSYFCSVKLDTGKTCFSIDEVLDTLVIETLGILILEIFFVPGVANLTSNNLLEDFSKLGYTKAFLRE